ncbi:hypothetical protein GXM_01214 [Nostoc sphaeroides CCNUC1]|uniref:Uncharacterized protein n=1 Tax=Nostoc sphaeroides CCNUC1 TaxID=2653204 RepID=A0A5P8VTU5_9NOSO|nr:hypothetical protein GXM_01214 [Nostoc sphaeroides CCNUC1]
MDWNVKNFNDTGVAFWTEIIAIAITQTAKTRDVKKGAIFIF